MFHFLFGGSVPAPSETRGAIMPDVIIPGVLARKQTAGKEQWVWGSTGFIPATVALKIPPYKYDRAVHLLSHWIGFCMEYESNKWNPRSPEQFMAWEWFVVYGQAAMLPCCDICHRRAEDHELNIMDYGTCPNYETHGWDGEYAPRLMYEIDGKDYFLADSLDKCSSRDALNAFSRVCEGDPWGWVDGTVNSVQVEGGTANGS